MVKKTNQEELPLRFQGYLVLPDVMNDPFHCRAHVHLFAQLCGQNASYVTFWVSGGVESELLHTYSRVDALDVLVLLVRLAVLVAVTLTVPVVLFPVRKNRLLQLS